MDKDIENTNKILYIINITKELEWNIFLEIRGDKYG